MRLIETIKKTLSADGFYKIETIKSLNAMYNMIIGGRGIAKSYEVKADCLKEAWEEDRLFGLLFRHTLDKNVSAIREYFKDLIERQDKYKYIQELTKGKADNISVKAGEIFFTKDDKKVKTCGYVFFLDAEERYKSGTYNNVHNLIFEEFISRKSYLQGELEMLDSLVSTVFRLRENCRVWLIGNSLSRFTPYRRGWGITGIDKQKPGTIDLYKKEFFHPLTGHIIYVDIAVELCKERSKQTYAMSKKGQQDAAGEWEIEECPKITVEEADKCMKLYEFYVVYEGCGFRLRLQKHYKSLSYFIYCVPYFKRITENEDKRIIGDVGFITNKVTKSFIPLVDRERFVFNLIKEEKVYFCDNESGTEFRTIYRSMT